MNYEIIEIGKSQRKYSNPSLFKELYLSVIYEITDTKKKIVGVIFNIKTENINDVWKKRLRFNLHVFNGDLLKISSFVMQKFNIKISDKKLKNLMNNYDKLNGNCYLEIDVMKPEYFNLKNNNLLELSDIRFRYSNSKIRPFHNEIRTLQDDKLRVDYNRKVEYILKNDIQKMRDLEILYFILHVLNKNEIEALNDDNESEYKYEQFCKVTKKLNNHFFQCNSQFSPEFKFQKYKDELIDIKKQIKDFYSTYNFECIYYKIYLELIMKYLNKFIRYNNKIDFILSNSSSIIDNNTVHYKFDENDFN